jgi:hypothetical protein
LIWLPARARRRHGRAITIGRRADDAQPDRRRRSSDRGQGRTVGRDDLGKPAATAASVRHRADPEQAHLTNGHVIAGGGTLSVSFARRPDPGATIVVDAAPISRSSGQATGLSHPSASGKDQVGEGVLAIGSPLGQFTDTVTGDVGTRPPDRNPQADRPADDPITSSRPDAAINPQQRRPLPERPQVVGIATATSTSAQGLGCVRS